MSSLKAEGDYPSGPLDCTLTHLWKSNWHPGVSYIVQQLLCVTCNGLGFQLLSVSFVCYLLFCDILFQTSCLFQPLMALFGFTCSRLASLFSLCVFPLAVVNLSVFLAFAPVFSSRVLAWFSSASLVCYLFCVCLCVSDQFFESFFCFVV